MAVIGRVYTEATQFQCMCNVRGIRRDAAARTTVESDDALCLLGILSMFSSSILPLHIFASAWVGCREVRDDELQEATDIEKLSREHLEHLPDFLFKLSTLNQVCVSSRHIRYLRKKRSGISIV
jgi:hypothetical protein